MTATSWQILLVIANSRTEAQAGRTGAGGRGGSGIPTLEQVVTSLHERIEPVRKEGPAYDLPIALGVIIVGGVKRIALFAEIVVPFMALAYIVMAFVILFFNVGRIPELFTLILRLAALRPWAFICLGRRKRLAIWSFSYVQHQYSYLSSTSISFLLFKGTVLPNSVCVNVNCNSG